MFQSALIALLLPVLSACSTASLLAQTPPLQANLASPCPPLSKTPTPFVDPPRSEWEAELIIAYAECAAKHSATVKAWPKSSK